MNIKSLTSIVYLAKNVKFLWSIIYMSDYNTIYKNPHWALNIVKRQTEVY